MLTKLLISKSSLYLSIYHLTETSTVYLHEKYFETVQTKCFLTFAVTSSCFFALQGKHYENITNGYYVYTKMKFQVSRFQIQKETKQITTTTTTKETAKKQQTNTNKSKTKQL